MRPLSGLVERGAAVIQATLGANFCQAYEARAGGLLLTRTTNVETIARSTVDRALVIAGALAALVSIAFKRKNVERPARTMAVNSSGMWGHSTISFEGAGTGGAVGISCAMYPAPGLWLAATSVCLLAAGSALRLVRKGQPR
jgi:hypothetical protein